MSSMEPRPSESAIDAQALAQRVAQLAEERGALFDKASNDFGLSTIGRERLASIERELDECFLSRRRQRADLDARRFENEGTRVRRVPMQRPQR